MVIKMTNTLRSPICTFLGHIDHGKTSIQDSIRGSAIAKGEAGGITQSISSTNLPILTIKDICGDLLEKLKIDITIPGILFIDTPGHASFNNLRKRGGNLADIAILVIDINEGVMPQTIECIELLKSYKTPFIVAANKIDLITGWRTDKNISLIENLKKQSEYVVNELDEKIYKIVGRLSEFGFNSERFDRIDDYTKQIAIAPVSAKTGEGIAELLMVVTGLSQRYLESKLKVNSSSFAKGIILEVKEEAGLGKTLDVIIYDGTLKKNDLIVIGGIEEAIKTKVKALFEMAEGRLVPVDKVNAAIGVKIIASEIENVFAGMPLRSVDEGNVDKAREEIQKEVREVLISTDKEGIIVKAESLGSLEALINLLKEKNVSIERASIGEITKHDLAEASSEKNPLYKVILGFNIKPVDSKDARIICDEVIYKVIEDFEKWISEKQREIEFKQLEGLIRPCKIKILPGCIFHQSNPAIVGVSVISGTLYTNTPLIKENGIKASEVKSIQLENENIPKAERNKEAAISLPGLIAGRQINENDILYADVPEEDFRKFKKLKHLLNPDELGTLKEIADIKRKENPMWGV